MGWVLIGFFGFLILLAWISDYGSDQISAICEQEEMDREKYDFEIWGSDNPCWDNPDYEPPSFDAWWRERQAPKLPAEEIPKVTPYR